jgi:hypothetical protein
MAMTVRAMRPVAHVPFLLGMGRKLDVAAIMEACLPSHPDKGLSSGRGVEALVLALLDGHHARSKVGTRWEERGRWSLLQEGRARESLTDDRLGQMREALCAANLHQVCGASALQALAVSAMPTPWRHQDTTTMARYGTEDRPEEGRAATRVETAEEPAPPVAPRPASGQSHEGRPARKPVLLRLGVRGDGSLPRRLGLRDGKTRDSLETPVALDACLPLGLAGGMGLVAARTASSQRPLGRCIEQPRGLVPLVPRPWAVRQALAGWGRQQPAWPLGREKPGRSHQESPRQGRGHRVDRRVAVEYAAGRPVREDVRCVVGHSRALAPQEAKASASAHAKEAAPVAHPITRRAAQSFVWVTAAKAALAASAGRGPGRRGRRPQPWRAPTLRSHVEACTRPQKRARRGRPPKDAGPSDAGRSRLRVDAGPRARAEADNGWTVLATPVATDVCAAAPSVHASHEQHSPGAQGLRWSKHPAAITPGGLEKPERMAAVAMLTVVGRLVYALMQRQGRLVLQRQQPQLPGNKGPTATPTAAVVLALCAQVMMIHVQVDQKEVCQVDGLREHHGMVCEALGVALSWYGTLSTQQNAPMSTTPP